MLCTRSKMAGTIAGELVSVVNWKEDFEFLYCLFMLVSLIAIFFSLYDSLGAQSSAIALVMVGLVEAVFGFFLFGSSLTSRLWNKLGKSDLPK